MGKGIKKAVTGVVTLAMLSSSLSAFASTVSVPKVEVLNSATEVANEYTSLDNISLTPSQMLRVTVAVSGATADSVFATFLSKAQDATTLDNSNVQYVGQAKVSGDGNTATFTFRPRLTTGTYSAMAGGTEATSPATFNYTVKEADKTITLTGVKNGLPANSTDDATFKIGDFAGTDYSGFKVYLDNSETELASEKYSVAKDGENLVLTIKNVAFTGKTKGTDIAVKLTHEGYFDVTEKISITAGVYNVTWELDSGSSTGTMPTTYTDGDTLTLPADSTMTKTGHTFEGWYTESDFTGDKVTSIATASDKLTFYAKWTAKMYGVTLNKKDGTLVEGETDVTGYTYGVGVATLPTLEKTGYTFKGWFTDEKCQNSVGETAISTTDTESKTFYAGWEAKNYTVTLNPGDGTIAENDKLESYTYGVGATLPKPTLDGWTFVGWCVNETATEGETYVTEIGKTDIGEKTYYARWSKNAPTEFLVTFKDDGESGKVWQSENVAVGTKPTYTGETPTKVVEPDDGYTYVFEKWTPDIVDVTGTAVYTAVYKETAKTYDMTYDLNGGTAGDNAPSQYTYGTGVALVDPTKKGHEFKGWYTDSTFTNSSKITSVGTSTKGNLQLYANWSQIDYTITYDAKGGTINGTYATTYHYGDTVTLPTDVTNGTKVFGGWYTTADCTGTPVTTIDSEQAENKQFYAKWTANSTGGDDGNGGGGNGGSGSTTPSEPSTPTTVPVVAGSLENKMTVEKSTTTTGEGATAVTSTTLTLAPKTGETLPTTVKMYKVEYDSNGVLVSITEVTATTTDGGKTFTFDNSLSSGTSANVMLVSSNLTPIIGAIGF